MNDAELDRFRAFAQSSPEFQQQLRQVQSPAELIQLAHARGFELSDTDLLIGARDWQEEHWVWSGKSKQFFRFFFHERRLPRPDELSAL